MDGSDGGHQKQPAWHGGVCSTGPKSKNSASPILLEHQKIKRIGMRRSLTRNVHQVEVRILLILLEEILEELRMLRKEMASKDDLENMCASLGDKS